MTKHCLKIFVRNEGIRPSDADLSCHHGSEKSSGMNCPLPETQRRILRRYHNGAESAKISAAAIVCGHRPLSLIRG